jgi:tetratricopeptide (TPR) repeat protein
VQPAEDLHRRAVAALNARRFAQADRLLERASAATSDPDLEARVQASRAFLEYETGDPAAAFERCDVVLGDAGLSAETRGIVQCQLAMLLLRRGRTAEALSAFSDAIGALRDPDELGTAHVNRGGVYLAQNRADLARADFSRARDYWRSTGKDREAAIATHNLGYACFLLGDLIGALTHMGAAASTLETMSPVMAATVSQDRAEVLLAAGLVQEGREALREAARAFGRRRMHQRRGEAELALARTLIVEDPRLALTTSRSAAQRFRLADAEAWRFRAEAQSLAAEVELGRKGPSLLLRSALLERELEEQGLRWGATTVRLLAGRVLLRRGDVDAAAVRLGAVRADRKAPLFVRLLARDVRAELAAQQGRRSRALDHLREGLEDLHTWQSSFGSLDLQTMVVGRGTRLGVRGLALAVDSRNPDVLFEWSERGRMLASRVQPVRAPEDESIAEDLAELRAMAQPAGGVRPWSPDREAELRQRVRERAWHHHGSGEVDDPISLGQLRDGLGAGTALVAYVVTGQRAVALVVTDRAATQFDLGERARLDERLDGLLPDLDMAATDLPGPLAGVVRQQLAERLDDLAGILVTPLLEAVGDRQVVLTPSGVLAAVPWTLLRGFVGRPVTVAQSATSWLARQSSALRAESAGLVAGPRVARAEEEVLAAAKAWHRSDVLIGGRASAEAVSQLASSVDVLHVAAHGRHSAENPMFSGLELVDGPWYGYDLDQLRAVPDVVVLSACEVGASTVRWGEELIGMASAWLHAGTRRVVASAAAVNDAAAFEALVGVHEQLAAGVDPAVALANAVPAVSADSPPVPLVCFG